MAVLLFLLLTLILFGAGFAFKALWILALVFLAAWVLGFAAHGPQRRWYYW